MKIEMVSDTRNISADDVVSNLPPLMLSMSARERLLDLASAVMHRMPEVATLLLDEADRANTVAYEDLPPDVIQIGSHIEFRDEDTGACNRVQLVYPSEADINFSKISILSLVGAGLIGLSVGQSINWPTHSGRLRRITVLKVSQKPFNREPC